MGKLSVLLSVFRVPLHNKIQKKEFLITETTPLNAVFIEYIFCGGTLYLEITQNSVIFYCEISKNIYVVTS
jgi:hypothetical protein